MNVLVNAMSIKDGGSLVVLQRMIRDLSTLDRDVVWHLVLNSKVKDLSEFTGDQINCFVFHRAERSTFFNYYFYWVTLPRLARKLRTDVLFSLTNYLPVFSRIPSLLLVQNAGHFSIIFQELQKSQSNFIMRFAWWAKRRRVMYSVRKANMVTVQTEALASAICETTGIPGKKIVVIPHGTGICELGGEKQFPLEGPWRIGYITTYGVQKNYLDLFDAVSLLRKKGRNVILVLTLDKELSAVRTVLKHARGLGIENCIENLGLVPQEDIQRIYDTLDLFVFPSLCESFGFPMIEAMARGLPLVVSDVPGNREVAGIAGVSYQPGNAPQLADIITGLLINPTLYRNASKASLKRSEDFSWRRSAEKTFSLIESLRKDTPIRSCLIRTLE